MKRLLLISASLFFVGPIMGSAQGISQLQQFTSTTSPSAITQTVYGKALRLSGQSTGCAQFSSNGTLTSSGLPCGGDASFPFTPQSWGNSTSTTLGFLNGFLSAASSTINAALRLPALSTGGLGIGTGGLVYAGATTTAGTGLTYSANAFNVDTVQNIGRLSNLTSNGFVKTSGSDGTLSVDTSTYLTSAGAVTSLTGTANQVSVSGSTGAVTVSLAGPHNFTTLTGLALGSGTSAISAYGGASCTNQFPRSQSASGAWTCATVANTDLANSSLTLNGTSISLGASGTITAASSTLLANNNTWSGLQSQSAASTSALTVSSFFQLPNSASQSPTIAGACAFDTTSGQLKCGDGASTQVIGNGKIESAFVLATSSLGTGTTTLKVSGYPSPTTFSKLGCISPAGGGSFMVQQGDGTASSTTVVSGGGNTTSFTTLASNNAFIAGESIFYAIGTVSGSVSNPSCSYQRALTAD